jgi:hypothetical protein
MADIVNEWNGLKEGDGIGMGMKKGKGLNELN